VPVKQIVDLAHRAGALALVDGAQSVSHLRVDVGALDADFFVFSGHKIFGPTGIGVVYGKREVLQDMPPWQGGGNMISDVTFERTVYHAPPTRFEAGTGNIADAVTVGTGSGLGAFLSPGNSATKPGTLTINNNTLTFNSDSTYKCALDRTTVTATQVAAKGVTIKSGARFVFGDFFTTGTLTTGTVLTVINNTSASAIVGTFSNLPNGSTLASNGNNFQVNYRGGTGNDLTLTVVP